MNRGTHPNSRENLALGAKARSKGKEQHCVTILPETWIWLSGGSNASERIDEMVGKLIRGEMVAIQHLHKAEARIAQLEEELRKLRVSG